MEDYFKYNIPLMKQIGAWPLPNIRQKELTKQTLECFYMLLYIWEAVSITLEVYDHRDDIFLIVEGTVEILTMIQSFIKMCSFLIRRDYIRNILLLMYELRINTPIDNSSTVIKICTEKWMKQAHVWVKLMIVSFLVPMLVFVLIPWIVYYKKGIKIIFFPSKLQDDYMEWKYYIPLETVEVVASWSAIVLNITGETFFATIIMFLCSRVDILKETIRNSVKESIEMKKTTQLFGICVEYHKKVLRACEMLENFYSPMLFLQFLCSTLTICISSFLAMQNSAVLDKGLSFKLYLVGIILELFVYCYFGQLLQTKFEELEISASHEPWYDTPISYQKNLKFFLTRCQKPVILTAYKISPVNLESFSSICKASASYYTILRSFTEDI